MPSPERVAFWLANETLRVSLTSPEIGDFWCANEGFALVNVAVRSRSQHSSVAVSKLSLSWFESSINH